MKGRTPRSLLRQAAEWTERGKRPPKLSSVRWTRSNIGEFACVERDERRSPRSWAIRELLTAADLVSEGQAMQHCVATYVRECARRETSIWSLQLEFQGRWNRVMTIEVDLKTRTICEARRRANVSPTPRARGIMERWAAQEGLAIAC
jgi:hypothetical protein